MAYLDDVTNILEIRPNGLPTVVRLSQNENGRKLYFRLTGNETAIPSGVTVTISGTKPDGVVYSASGTITNDIVLINENTQMTAVAGTWDAKIKIVSSGQTIATGRVRFEIDADTVAPGSVPSDSELEGLVAEAQAYAENARSAAYGSPLVASTVAGMTDHTRVYVYTGSETGYTAGNWYYWNGSAWTSGGVYNSTALQTDMTLAIPGMAADAKATGDAIGDLDTRLDTAEDDITDVKSDLYYYEEEDIAVYASPEGWRLDGTGKCTEASSYKLVKYEVTAGDTLHLVLSKDVTSMEEEGVYQWQSAASVPSSLPNSGLVGTPVTESVNGFVTVPEDATYLIVSQFKTNTTNSVKLVTYTEKLKDKVDELEEIVDNLEPGLSEEAKEALLACLEHVAWVDNNGQDYYNALYSALYGALDYVHNGLIAYWDGINNTGNGHDSSASAWTDLVNGYSLSRVETSNTTWIANGVDLAGIIDTTQGFSSGTGGRLWTPSENCTIEVALACEKEGENQSLVMFDSENTNPTGNRNHRHIIFYSDGTIGYQSVSSNCYVNPLQSVMDIKHVAVTYSGYSTTGVYVNGVQASVGSASHSFRKGDPNEYIGFGSQYNAHELDGKIYSVRIYNRALTSEELAQNLAYDNARFNLGLSL